MVYSTQNHWAYGLCPVIDIGSFCLEDENRSSFRNVVFSGHLELLMMEKVYNLCVSYSEATLHRTLQDSILHIERHKNLTSHINDSDSLLRR
jgi:hypothetical protein